MQCQSSVRIYADFLIKIWLLRKFKFLSCKNNILYRQIFCRLIHCVYIHILLTKSICLAHNLSSCVVPSYQMPLKKEMPPNETTAQPSLSNFHALVFIFNSKFRLLLLLSPSCTQSQSSHYWRNLRGWFWKMVHMYILCSSIPCPHTIFLIL